MKIITILTVNEQAIVSNDEHSKGYIGAAIALLTLAVNTTSGSRLRLLR